MYLLFLLQSESLFQFQLCAEQRGQKLIEGLLLTMFGFISVSRERDVTISMLCLITFSLPNLFSAPVNVYLFNLIWSTVDVMKMKMHA